MPAWADLGRDATDTGFGIPGSGAPTMLAGVVAAATPTRERQRAFRLLGLARVAMAVLLLAWFLLTADTPRRPAPFVGVDLGLAYLALASFHVLLSLTRTRAFGWQMLAGVVTDLGIFGLMQFLGGVPAREFVLSYTLPVLAAGLFGTLRFTLATAAGVALILLSHALWTQGMLSAGAEPQLIGAGFVGAAYFAMGALAWQLSQRLARQEDRARRSEIRANRPLAINRHVLLEQPDGVLVLDGALRVETANPAAGRLLGLRDWELDAPGAEPLTRYPGASILADAVRRQAGSQHEPVVFDAPGGLRLQARVQPLRNLPGGPAYVVFVQDLRDVTQQMQQEKLAALGRLVAAVAHEIRNPLTAISQANQLASEPGLNAPQRARMNALIAQNVDRLNRIVEDVLDLGRAGTPDTIDLQPLRMLRELQSEFSPEPTGRIAVFADDPLATVQFDPQHLRRVLVNLLSNACRFASAGEGAIRVRLRGTRRLREISVANDCPVVAPELRAQLFEPFFTTDSRGTGLGLYICQELCARHGARIEYRVRRAQGPSAFGEFVIHPQLARHSPRP